MKESAYAQGRREEYERIINMLQYRIDRLNHIIDKEEDIEIRIRYCCQLNELEDFLIRLDIGR